MFDCFLAAWDCGRLFFPLPCPGPSPGHGRSLRPWVGRKGAAISGDWLAVERERGKESERKRMTMTICGRECLAALTVNVWG